MNQSIVHPRTRHPIAQGQRFQWTRTKRPHIGRPSVALDVARRGATALMPYSKVETVEVVQVSPSRKMVRARVGGQPPEWYGPRDYLSWEPMRGVRYAAEEV